VIPVKTTSVMVILSILLLAEQAVASESSEGRFYPGPPRPAGEIALIVGDVWGGMWVCPYFSTLTEEAEAPKTLFGQKTLAEVLPGHYMVTIGCDNGNAMFGQGLPVEVKIEAKAGHVYYVMLNGKSLLVLDLTRDEDYRQLKQGTRVKAYVEKYLRGKRHEVKEQRNAIARTTGWY
jgi:hypothetical protein